jgi:hypothetical protein
MQSLPSWAPKKDSLRCRESSIALARAVLEARSDLTTPHLREALKIAVWKYTECDGKYTTRYRSEAALGAVGKLIHHEHVIPIRQIVDRLLANPTGFEEILSSAVGCVVLRSEHHKLGEIDKAYPLVTGWDRYRLAEITVWDLAEGRRVS